MLYQPSMVWVKSARAARTVFVLTTKVFSFLLLALAIFCGVLLSQAHAQSPQEIDLSEFSYAVTVSGSTLNMNDVGTVTLTLGTSSLPLSDVIGLHLDLVLSSDAVLPSNPLEVTVNGSWLFDGMEVSQDLTVNDITRTMHLEMVLSDLEPQSGHGFALSFPIKSAANNVAASSLVVSDGGIVIVADIDGKMAHSTHSQTKLGPASASCFPNPTTGLLNVPLPQDAPAQVHLIGMDGRVHELEMNGVGGIGVADIAPYAQGMYIMEVWQGGKMLIREAVMRE